MNESNEPIQKDEEDILTNETTITTMMINLTGYFDGFVNTKKEKEQ
jgi:hypothetical protein